MNIGQRGLTLDVSDCKTAIQNITNVNKITNNYFFPARTWEKLSKSLVKPL